MDRSHEIQPLGEEVTDFSLPRIGGPAFQLGEYLEEVKLAAVVFWSAVCSHCRRYDGYLNEFPRKHPGVGLVAVAARQEETAESLRRALRERELTFPVLHDAERRVSHAWLVKQTPRVFLVDARRRLLYRGAIDNFKYPGDPEHEAYLDEAVAAVLAGRDVPRAETPSFGCPIESVYYEMPKP